MAIPLCVYYFVIVPRFLNILFSSLYFHFGRERKRVRERKKKYVCVFSLTGCTPLTKQLCPWTAFFISVSDFDFNTLICFLECPSRSLRPICSCMLSTFTFRALSIFIILKIAQVVPLKNC